MNTTLPGPGEAPTGAAVRRVFEAALAGDAKKAESREAILVALAAAAGNPEFREAIASTLAAAAGKPELREELVSRLAAAAEKPELHHFSETDVRAVLGEEVSTAEKVATGYRIELVTGSARSLWLRAGTEEWQLDNPTDAMQASVQAAFCCPGQELVFRHRRHVIIELEVRKASSSKP